MIEKKKIVNSDFEYWNQRESYNRAESQIEISYQKEEKQIKKHEYWILIESTTRYQLISHFSALGDVFIISDTYKFIFP